MSAVWQKPVYNHCVNSGKLHDAESIESFPKWQQHQRRSHTNETISLCKQNKFRIWVCCSTGPLTSKHSHTPSQSRAQVMWREIPLPKNNDRGRKILFMENRKLPDESQWHGHQAWGLLRQKEMDLSTANCEKLKKSHPSELTVQWTCTRSKRN